MTRRKIHIKGSTKFEKSLDSVMEENAMCIYKKGLTFNDVFEVLFLFGLIVLALSFFFAEIRLSLDLFFLCFLGGLVLLSIWLLNWLIKSLRERINDKESVIVVSSKGLHICDKYYYANKTFLWKELSNATIEIFYLNAYKNSWWYLRIEGDGHLYDLFCLEEFDVDLFELKKELDKYHPNVKFVKQDGYLFFGWKKYERANQGIYE